MSASVGSAIYNVYGWCMLQISMCALAHMAFDLPGCITLCDCIRDRVQPDSCILMTGILAPLEPCAVAVDP